MSFKFQHKKIWIVSPQPWGKLKVSKHHYAITLAEKGNKVFFIEPPTLSVKGIDVSVSEDNSNLSIVRYRPVFRGKRFLPAFVYRMLLKKQIGLLKKALAGSPDILWCFHHDLFLNLKWFGAPFNIFHLADLYHNKDIPPELFTADICIAVSPTIAEQIRPCGKPVFFINHGLNESFAAYARKQIQQAPEPPVDGKLKVGYIGNLMQEVIDRRMMKSIITAYPEICFIFWGPYTEAKENNLGGYCSDEVFEFVDFLKKAPNVILKGTCTAKEMLTEIPSVDMYWLCWKKTSSKIWDGSNSHKLLEYLATGRPVVAHFVETYRNSDLLYMMNENGTDSFEDVFRNAVDKIRKAEDPSLRNKRLKFALDNTYKEQVLRIESIVSAMMYE